MSNDDLIEGVRLIAHANKWPFRTALIYVALLGALIHPAVVTVFGILRPRRQQLIQGSFLRGTMIALREDGVDCVIFVDQYRGPLRFYHLIRRDV